VLNEFRQLESHDRKHVRQSTWNGTQPRQGDPAKNTELYEIRQENTKLKSEVQALREMVLVMTQSLDNFKLEVRCRMTKLEDENATLRRLLRQDALTRDKSVASEALDFVRQITPRDFSSSSAI